MKNTGIGTSLKAIASRAWRDRLLPAVYMTAKQLTDGSYGGKEEARNYTTNTQRVKSIVDYVADQNRKAGPLDPTHVESFRTSPPYDADEAVLAAATLCLAVGIRCRIVGARYGHSWTCWLAYQDEGQWITINVLEGRLVGSDRKPDEQIVVIVRRTRQVHAYVDYCEVTNLERRAAKSAMFEYGCEPDGSRRFEHRVQIELRCFETPRCGGRPMTLMGNYSLREAGADATRLGYECKSCFRRVTVTEGEEPPTPAIHVAHDAEP